MAITEPFAGSDVANLKTTAKKTPDGKHYVVNGSKKWITNGTVAKWFTTAVRTGGPGAGGISFLLIERPEDSKNGVLETRAIKTDYSTGAGTSLVSFEDLLVPVENLIGVENQGFPMIMANFNHERWSICSGVLARSRRVVEEAQKWAMQRLVFGKPLMSQPVIQSKFAQMYIELEVCQAYFEKVTGWMNQLSYKEQAAKLGGPISLLKAKCTRVAELIADHTFQIFGGRAVTRSGMGRLVERFGRSVKHASIYGGSIEIMESLGAKLAMKGYPKNARL